MEDLKSQIDELKEERLLSRQAMSFFKHTSQSRQPSEADVDRWKKYGRFFPGTNYRVGYSWKRLSSQEWVNFYEWLTEWIDLRIERLELQLESGSNTEELIEEFAEDFASSPNATRPEEEIKAYLNAWIHKSGYGRRAKAKKEAIQECSSLSDVADGTLTNWEEYWTDFLSSRTEE